MKKFKLVLFLLLLIGGLTAQNLDLSKLTPEQLAAYKKYKNGNTSVTNTTQENITPRTVVNYDNQPDSVGTLKNLKNVKKPTFSGGIFGSYLFSSQNLTFEPALNIPTPPNYILGTYDEMIIDISGQYEANYKIKVSPEGFIRIPNVSPIKVSGQTVENATKVIRSRLSGIYPGAQINVNLGSIRSIRVTVVGEAVRPGTYTLPSLATAFNALYACGGPDSIGTMRAVKVVRHGKVVANVDVYNFLLDGALTNNIALQDEDVIKIDPYKLRVSISGAVKRDGIFEALPGETLQQLIRFAGGYKDNAYKALVTTMRLTEKGRTVVDVPESELGTFLLQSGDSCFVSVNSGKYDNRVDITGSVYRPGAYALEIGMTVKQLIDKAQGVKEDAYLNMAYINRKQANRVPEIIGFNLGNVLKGITADVLLQKDDSVVIRSLFDYREGQSVSISGAVLEPGKFKLIENITLKDLIFKAKGFTEMANTDSVELVRVIKDPALLLNSNQKTIVMKFAMDKDLNFKKGSNDIILENGDQVIVRTISGYEDIRMVKVEGEVLQPGSYNITSKTERISDVIKRAGGFTKYSYPFGAFLIRTENPTGVQLKLDQIIRENSQKQFESANDNKIDANMLKAASTTNPAAGVANIDSLQNQLSNSNVLLNKVFKTEGIVGINLAEIMKNPGGKEDFYLEEGDDIFVPRELQTVRVMGEVLFPTYVGYQNGMNLKRYINNSGGFTVQAQKKKVFVLYPNGTAKSTKSFLGILFYPKVEPGSRIIVPEKPTEIKNPLSPGELVGILTSTASAMAIIYSVLKL
ncbi:MAG: SLBB domain-containing protein [Paludibacter sp.]|nr:SLBB domain-containing protein [Paludibacter sp.]